jgi:protoheme IX farnesyltransferase
MTKPGIILGNLFTVAAGFLLASKGNVDILLFFATLMGIIFIIASACVFNNYIDRKVDAKMERTKNRPLAAGLISAQNAILFATLLLLIGNWILFAYTNVLTLSIADFGFFVYVVLYSLWKCRTIYGTAIGSIAGAVPPVIGYCAVSNRLDAGALILFAIMVLWQMPHFFSIAIYHFDDYRAAKIPVLPIERGMLRTKIHMVIYIACFIFAAFLLTFFNFTGFAYLTVITCIGLCWLALCLKGFNAQNEKIWGRDMFRLSLVAIGAFCIMIPLNLADAV